MTKEIEKYEKDGMVAVLVSPGFGAGWSTWSSPEDFLAMDKTLVQMAIDSKSADEVEAYLNTKDLDIYMGGWPVSVEWVPKGTPFRIDEYDGSESLVTTNDFSLTA